MAWRGNGEAWEKMLELGNGLDENWENGLRNEIKISLFPLSMAEISLVLFHSVLVSLTCQMSP